jgi:hypothetical protein
MEKTIKLKSRACNKNYLELIDSDNKTYSLKVGYPYVRVGYDKGRSTIKFVDPSGGPMIVVGEVLEEAKAKIKSIDFVKDVGYTITFE